jgi:hypothetical protein
MQIKAGALSAPPPPPFLLLCITRSIEWVWVFYSPPGMATEKTRYLLERNLKLLFRQLNYICLIYNARYNTVCSRKIGPVGHPSLRS